MERRFKSMLEHREDWKNESKEKIQRCIQTNIKSVEIDTGMKLKKTEGLVNGKPTFASTFVFEQRKD